MNRAQQSKKHFKSILEKHIKGTGRKHTLSKLLMLEKSKGLGRPAPAVGEAPFFASDSPSDFESLFWSEM
jgi:hypothetical protein